MSVCRELYNKSSAASEMGNRGHNRHGLKGRGCCAPFADTIDRRGQVTWRQDFRGMGSSPANILIPLERQLIALLDAADSFYIMKLCSRLFVLYCRSRPKDSKSRHFDPHFEEVRGGVEPWWMALWKARTEFLLSVIELLFLSLTVEALQGKMCQDSLLSG